jgi:hypothetical protein
LRRWQAAHLRGAPELPLRWTIPIRSQRQLPKALHSYRVQPNVKNEPMPRACLGLFSAAESLSFGCVHGVPPHFYLESLDREVLSRIGVSAESAECRADVYVRVPASSRVLPRRDRSRRFYAELLASLEGSEVKRGGWRDVTALFAASLSRGSAISNRCSEIAGMR